MNFALLPTELHIHQKYLGQSMLESNPQPGQYLEYEGELYLVLERKHRYQFKRGRYHLVKMIVSVQTAQHPSERSLWQGNWVIGDASCRFNAHSELIRCAVNPSGPCQGCRSREAMV
jgi:hypothetical protein